MVNRKRKATTTIDTNVSTIVDNNDNSEAINNESIGRIKSKNSKSKSSTTTIVDNGDDHDDHHQPSKSKSSKRSTRRTTPASNQSTSNNSNNNVDDDHDQIESQVDKSKIKRTRGNRKQVESTIASNSDDIASTSTNLVDNVKTTKKSAKPTKNVTFDIDTVNIEEDKTKQTLRRSSRTTTRASTAASSAVAKISTSSSSSSSSSTTASRKKTTATKSDTPIKQSAPSSSRSRAKKQDKPESIEPIENSQEDQHVEKESMVKSKRSSKSSKQSETKFKKTTTTTQNEQHEETKNEPEPTVISKKRSTRGVKSKPEVVENVVDNEPKEVKERPRSTRKTAAATSVTESSSKSTNKRSTQKQRNKTELVDEIQTTELENVEEETKTESSKRKSARNLTKSMNQAAVETEPEQTTSEPKKSVAATAKSKRPRRGAASTVVEEVIKESEPEIPSLVQDEPDFIQQIPVTKPETENEKNIPNHSESEEQISANNNVEEKKIAEVVDKVNEIVDVIESETNISQSLSSLTAAATTVAKEDTEKIDEKVNNETCSKESKMPKNQVSFEIVDMDDNEEIEPDTHVIAIDHEQMIIDDGSRSSMPSSIESKDKQSDLDLDSTIIVIEDSQSSDGSLLQPSIQSISVVNEAESLATNSNGQSMVIEDDNDERGSKRKVPDSFTISSEDTMQSPVAKKARFELPDHGDLFTMGDQISKELGPREIYFHGRKTLRSQPAKVRIGSYKIKQVAMGALHTLALTVNGQILSFGCNDDYVLGRFITREEYTNNLITNGGDDDLDELDVDDDEFEEKLSGRPLPVKELRSKTVVKVSAGDMHSAALCDDGKVYVWGNFKDDSDKVGLFVDCEKSPNCSDYLPVILPKQVEIDMKIIDIASGSHHILMLTEEGNVFTFGDGSKGQLGRIVSTELNSIKTNRDLFLRPQMVSIPEQAKIEHVFASQWNSFALSTDGNLYGWGLNNYFQLGLKNDFISQANSLNSDSLFTLIPTRIPLSFKCKQVSNGQQHSLALDNDGNVYACGSALYGKLGLGEDFIRQCNNDKSISDFKQIPSTIFNKERVIKVDCGDFCSMAITETGKLYCWGQGGLQIGTSADEDLFEPRQIKNGPYDECTRFISISTGAQMAAMIGTIINDDDNDNDLQMD
uniref:Cell wall protein DAN4-like isoform X2 n=1 Tax=Dermatophagoides pteronyssinus TaxID=6956 RepID=A0A6P6Y3G7_DERPT|nr:cell wall protein DAN4-like isoform X2 [Dermatophagoides pteronyssinus]